jgi:hypothetical protein
VRQSFCGSTTKLISFNCGQQAIWESTELPSMRMPQAQLIPRFVSDKIPRNDRRFNLLHMVVQKNDADWAETKGKQKGDFYKMVSNLIV